MLEKAEATDIISQLWYSLTMQSPGREGQKCLSTIINNSFRNLTYRTAIFSRYGNIPFTMTSPRLYVLCPSTAAAARVIAQKKDNYNTLRATILSATPPPPSATLSLHLYLYTPLLLPPIPLPTFVFLSNSPTTSRIFFSSSSYITKVLISRRAN